MKAQPPGKGEREASEDGPVRKGALSKGEWLGVGKSSCEGEEKRGKPKGRVWGGPCGPSHLLNSELKHSHLKATLPSLGCLTSGPNQVER